MDVATVGGIFVTLGFVVYLILQTWEENEWKKKQKDLEIRGKLEYLGIEVNIDKLLTQKDYEYIVRGL